jgi:hypothetical protein
VAGQRVAGVERPLAHGGPPVAVGGGEGDLLEHQVDHAVQELVLVGDVVVERHRSGAELVGEHAHAEGV